MDLPVSFKTIQTQARLWIFIMAALLLTRPVDLVAQKSEAGIIRLGTYRALAPLNPLETSDTFSTPLMDILFNRLIRFDKHGRYQPDLAEKWEISSDGRTYTFELRKGVRFHDGAEMTAEDAVYSIQLAADPASSASISGTLKSIEEIKTLSSHSLQIRLKEPFAPFLLSLWRVCIIPKHKLADFKKDLPGFLSRPVGTGPYMFEGQDASGLRLKSNPGYFEGAPQTDGVHVTIYESRDQLMSAFLREELDMVFYLDWTDFGEISRNDDFQTLRSLSVNGYALIFNLRKELLKKSEIREAVACALNRQELIDKLENGSGVLMEGPFHPESWAYDSGVRPALYDPQRTARILAANGFDAGKKLSLKLLVDARNEQLVRIGKMIRQQLQESGISTEFRYFNNYEEFKRNVYQESEIDLFLTSVGTGPDPDVASRYWETGESIDISGYSRSEADALFRAARESAVPGERAAAYKKIQAMITEDRPAVFLYFPYALHAAVKNLQNVDRMSGSFILFQRLKDVRKEAVQNP